MGALGELDSLAHVEVPVFQGAVARRGASVVVVVARVHQVDTVPHRLGIAAAAFVVGVVQVGDAEGVRVFMAESADGGEGGKRRLVLVLLQFRGACIVVHQDAVPTVGYVGAGLEIPHMGPDIVGAGSFGLIGPCVEDEDIVHLSVTVVVVVGEIDVGTHGLAGVHDHLGGVFVFVVIVVGAVVGILVRKGDDLGDVELEGVAVLPLVFEIGEGRCDRGSVDEVLEPVLSVAEFQVLELGQDDEAVADAAAGAFGGETPGAGHLPGAEREGAFDTGDPFPAEQVVGDVAAGGDDVARRVRIADVFAGIQPMAVEVVAGVAPPAFGVLDDRAAVQRGGQVAVLIAGEGGLDNGPVRLPEIHDASQRG